MIKREYSFVYLYLYIYIHICIYVYIYIHIYNDSFISTCSYMFIYKCLIYDCERREHRAVASVSARRLDYVATRSQLCAAQRGESADLQTVIYIYISIYIYICIYGLFHKLFEPSEVTG